MFICCGIWRLNMNTKKYYRKHIKDKLIKQQKMLLQLKYYKREYMKAIGIAKIYENQLVHNNLLQKKSAVKMDLNGIPVPQVVFDSLNGNL